VQAQHPRSGPRVTADSGLFSNFRRHRAAIVVAGLAVAIGLWWLFRPEQLFLNQQVNETAPAGIASAQPLFTGSLRSIGNSSQTTGRASIFKNGGQLQLEISKLASNAATSFSVALAPSAESISAANVIGSIKIGGSEKLTIPPGLDPAINKTLFLTDDSRKVIAKATLESF
jgi:hypothetical protein